MPENQGLAEDSGLGRSMSACILMDQLVVSEDWREATKVVNAIARRFGPLGLREDVLAETQARILESVAKNVTIRNLRGFSARVALSVVRLLCKQDLAVGIGKDADEIAAAEQPAPGALCCCSS